MTHRISFLLAILSLLLAACGGAGPSPAATGPGGAAVSTVPPSAAAQSPAPAATTAASASPMPTAAAQPSATAAATTAAPVKPVKVTLALDWTPNTNHTGFYVAQQKGWYREAGIDLQILPYSESTSTDLLVSNGKADFGISFVESVVLARAAGEDVVSTAAIVQHNTSALVTLKKSGLDRPIKLDGKRYAGFGTPFEQPVISDMIRCDGGKGQFKSVTANLYGYAAVKAGQADFVWIYMGWEGIQAKREGVDLNVFYVNKYCVPDYPSPVIITSGKKLKQDPEVVKRFMAATARGYEYAIANPGEAAGLLIKGAPQGTFPDPGLVKESQQWLSPKYKEGQQKWGVQTAKGWTEYPRFMFKTGRVTDARGKPVKQEPDYSSYYTNDYLP